MYTTKGKYRVKAMPVFFLDANEDEGTVRHIVSVMGIVDEGKDLIHRGSFNRSIAENGPNGRDRIKAHYQHDFNEPIGKPISMREIGREELPESVLRVAPNATGGLELETKISMTRRGQDAFLLLKDRVLKEWSVGLLEVDSERDQRGINHIRDLDLLEYSLVTLGMNPATDTMSVKNICPNCQNKKAVVAYQNLPLEDEDTPWDSQQAEADVRKWAGGADDLADMDWKKYQTAFVMWDRSAPESVASYKLQIATVDNNELVAIPRGVFAAAATLQGAKEPIVEFDTGDSDGAKTHLKRYYDRMERIAPWERQNGFIGTNREVSIEEKIILLDELSTSLKAGRVISAANRGRIKEACDAMRKALEALDPLMAARDETPEVNDPERISTLSLVQDLKKKLLWSKLRSARNMY